MGNEVKEESEKRPWYKRKTEQGVIISFIGIALSFIPITAPVAIYVINLGTIWAGAGVIHRNIKGQVQ